MHYPNNYYHKPLYISELQEFVEKLPNNMKQKILLYLTVNAKNEYRILEFYVPTKDMLRHNTELYKNYILAMVNNFIVTFGGVHLDFYYNKDDEVLSDIIYKVIWKFDLNSPNNYRKGYGVFINYINRMNKFLGSDNFRMNIYDISEFKLPEDTKEYRIYNPVDSESQVGMLRRAAMELDGKCICSLDIGGNSIKGAVVKNGEIEFLKEFEWCPISLKNADEMLNPILLMLKFFNSCMYYKDKGKNIGSISHVFKRDATLESIDRAVRMMTKDMSEDTKYFDAVVIGFPDIVVNNKIAGGEVYKLLGMRKHTGSNYESEFIKLSALDEHVKEYVKKDGVVCVLNDGNAASYIVSVEQAFSGDNTIPPNGMLVHTIGTEMGTGFVSRGGTIQRIPLECYQYIIDLGNIDLRKYPAEDIRSINNLNTEIPGTVQKYISQLGLFRIATTEMFKNNRPLFESLLDKGLLEYSDDKKMLAVPMSSVDKRPELTRYLIKLLEENNEQVKLAFKTMGKALGILIDQGRILFPEIDTTRLLSGGLVACDTAYELIYEGLKEHNSDYHILRLDENVASSELLKKMTEQQRSFNVAIGSAYIANRIMIGMGKGDEVHEEK